MLASAGVAAVAVNYARSGEDAAETVADLKGSGIEADSWQADVGNDAAVRAMVDDVVRRYGRIDVLVNNAGTTVFAPFVDLDALTDEVWEGLLRVNVLGAFYCARAAAPSLRATKGAIVNVSSISGVRAAGSSLAYGVSKAALLQLTRGLALALAPDVRVNAVSPGMVTTRWHSSHVGLERAEANALAEAEKTPLKAVADADAVAGAIMALLGADFVTGESVIVDGGKHLLY
jgi:3-oxoacyl-[acyl-carrier protein] reductase